ncbi:MAG: hypothetical protein HC872_03130 [Gammaproteobacteria bacterium]|nr:hypothetical protein [Gammaproteobacteria bacterium]
MTIRIFRQGVVLLLAALLLAACGGQKEPAQKAIDNAERAIAAIRDDAARYMPDDLKDLESSLAGMKDNFAKEKYPAVLTAGRSLNTRIAAVTSAVAAERAENQAMNEQATEQWNAISQEVPEMVEKVNARLASLEKSRKLPKDVDQATLDQMKATAETMTQNWQQALGAFSNGNMQEAVDMAQMARDKATTVMTTLGIT